MYLTVSEAAAYLDMTENAVRNRVKRGSLQAIKAGKLSVGKAQQVLVCVPVTPGVGGGLSSKKTTNNSAEIPTNLGEDDWEVVIAYQKRRIEDLQAERKRLNGLLTQHLNLLERETAWREGLQGQLDHLLARIESASPELDKVEAPLTAGSLSVAAVEEARAELENQLKPALSKILEALAKAPAD